MKENKRFTIHILGKNPMLYFSYNFHNSNMALYESREDMKDPEIISIFIIDTRNNIVEIIKGTLGEFREQLDQDMPGGWKEGKLITSS